MPENFPESAPIGILVERARSRLFEAEPDDQGGGQGNHQGREHRHYLPPDRGPEQTRKGWAEDISKISRQRHPPEVCAAGFLVAEIGKVGVGDRDVASGETVGCPGQENHEERKRQGELPQNRGVNVAQYGNRQKKRGQENQP